MIGVGLELKEEFVNSIALLMRTNESCAYVIGLLIDSSSQ